MGFVFDLGVAAFIVMEKLRRREGPASWLGTDQTSPQKKLTLGHREMEYVDLKLDTSASATSVKFSGPSCPTLGLVKKYCVLHTPQAGTMRLPAPSSSIELQAASSRRGEQTR